MSAPSYHGDPLGWCLDGHHLNCPGRTKPSEWRPDSRHTILIPEKLCPCDCHKRDKL